MKRSMVFAGAAASLLLAQAAWACHESNSLFEDDFSSADPQWGAYDGMRIADGKLTVRPDQNMGYALLNQASVYDSFDVCVDLVQDNQDPTTGYGGILFWGVDYDNYYTLDVATNGYVRVSRKQKNRWLTPVAWTMIQGVNAGTATNTARVVGQGKQATVYVNDIEVASFRGQPPADGGFLGVYGSSPTESKGVYEFDNFLVSEVSDESEPAPQPPAEAEPAPADTPPPAAPKPGQPGMPKTPG